MECYEMPEETCRPVISGFPLPVLTVILFRLRFLPLI